MCKRSKIYAKKVSVKQTIFKIKQFNLLEKRHLLFDMNVYN